MNTKKVIILAASGIVGGIAGYLVADLVAFKIQEKMIGEGILEEFNKITEEYISKSEEEKKEWLDGKRVNYQKKGDLTQLAFEAMKPSLEEALSKNLDPEALPLYEIISLDEHTDRGYPDKETILYYEDDQTFTNDEVIVDNITDLIGEDNLKFGEMSEDEDIVYIRNNDTETDYEVIRIHGKYSTLIMGLSEEETEPPEKPSRRKRTK